MTINGASVLSLHSFKVSGACCWIVRVLDVNMHTLYFLELFIVIRTLSQRSGTQHWISKLLAKTNQLSTQLPTMLHSIVPVLKVSSKKQPCYLYNVVLYVCVRQNERARERERIIFFAYKNTAASYLGNFDGRHFLVLYSHFDLQL